MKNKIWYRKTLRYKIKMWFYRLTFRDVENTTKKFFLMLFEIVISGLGFLILFLLPVFLR